MPNFVTLDEVAHSDLRVSVDFEESPQAQVNQTLILPTEFLQLAKEYPIFFRKDEDNKFFAIVLLGLDRGENLYLKNGNWDARYVPAVIERGPFGMAIPAPSNSLRDHDEPVLKIDLDDPRVSTERGEKLFLMHGGQAPYLEAISKVLNRIRIGTSLAEPFFDQLGALDLIEPLTLEAKFSEDLQYTIPDLYTISRERLANLGPEELHKLNSVGLLEHCFAIVLSMDNFSKIVDMKARMKSGL